jgi:hypothetical protein
MRTLKSRLQLDASFSRSEHDEPVFLTTRREASAATAGRNRNDLYAK